MVDTTLLVAPTSGGVRRYLLAKHLWLPRHTRARHTILVPGRNVEIQPLGVDVAALTPQARDPSLRLRVGIAPGARLLVFAGRPSREKRPRDLIIVLEAMACGLPVVAARARAAAHSWDRAITQLLGRYTRLVQSGGSVASRAGHAG